MRKIVLLLMLSFAILKADYEKLFKKVDNDLNIMREILNKE